MNLLSLLLIFLPSFILQTFAISESHPFINLKPRSRLHRKVKNSITSLSPGQIVCTSSKKLVEHDCNVALLGLGPGGIAGAIEFLRVNGDVTSATNGTCKITAQTTDGSNIDCSKGRLEHGGINGYENLLSQCGGSPGQVLVQGGAAGSTGNLLVTISPA